MHKRTRLVIGLLVAASLPALATCARGEPEPEPEATTAADTTATRARRDSAIAASRLPGAGVVGEALEARERMGERATAHDTIR